MLFFPEDFWKSLVVSIFLHNSVMKSKESEEKSIPTLTHILKALQYACFPLKTSKSNYWSEQWLGNSKSWVEEIKSIFNVEWLTHMEMNQSPFSKYRTAWTMGNNTIEINAELQNCYTINAANTLYIYIKWYDYLQKMKEIKYFH